MTVITISGLPGSGTTTISQLLEKKTKIPYIYSGEIFRKLAEKYGMSLEDFGKYCEENRKIDEELDKNQLEILKKGNVILEGRISGWIAYRNKIKSLKVILEADIKIRANRIVNRENGDVDKRRKEIEKREKSEATRYKNYYDIDVSDLSIYDLVIDTSNKTPDEIVEIILKKIKK